MLVQKLNDFKRELFVLCKTEIRQHSSDLLKFIQLKSMDAVQNTQASIESIERDRDTMLRSKDLRNKPNKEVP
jgi:hypothetical protein